MTEDEVLALHQGGVRGSSDVLAGSSTRLGYSRRRLRDCGNRFSCSQAALSVRFSCENASARGPSLGADGRSDVAVRRSRHVGSHAPARKSFADCLSITVGTRIASGSGEMTPIPLHVLIIDDSADDAELAKHRLQRDGYAVHCERVATPEALTAALCASPDWDVVLCDSGMPRLDTLQALSLVRERQPSPSPAATAYTRADGGKPDERGRDGVPTR